MLSVIVSPNTSVAGLVGEVNVGCATVVEESVTLGPLTCVQAYDVSVAVGAALEPDPSNVTSTPRSTI